MMKVVLLLSMACFAVLLGSSSAQSPINNPVILMANENIHDIISKLKETITTLIGKNELLKSLDISHVLNKFAGLTEEKVKDFLFNTVLPRIMKVLNKPSTKVRELLVKVNDYVKNLDVASIAANLPNYVKTFVNSVQAAIDSIDQLNSGAHIDVKTLNQLFQSTTTQPIVEATSQQTRLVEPTAATTAPPPQVETTVAPPPQVETTVATTAPPPQVEPTTTKPITTTPPKRGFLFG